MQKHLHIFSRRISLKSQASPLLATPCACDPRSGGSSSIRVWPPAASIPGTRSFSGAQCRGLLALYSEPSRRSVRGPLTCCLPVIIRQIAGGKRGGGGNHPFSRLELYGAALGYRSMTLKSTRAVFVLAMHYGGGAASAAARLTRK